MESPRTQPAVPPRRRPAEGRWLARRRLRGQEARSSRQAELGEDTLARALYAILEEVQVEQSVTIDATVLDDRPLDDCATALAAAAREALRNAARHAPGAKIVVFAELAASGSEVYITDDGPGFDPETIPLRRRGVRDAILTRMASVGGSATIESTLGKGTEVELRLPATGRASR